MSDTSPKITRIASDQECTTDGCQCLFAPNGGIASTPLLNALGVWVACQRVPPNVATAASAFEATEDVIRRAVEHHYWLFIDGDRIEMEGI